MTIPCPTVLIRPLKSPPKSPQQKTHLLHIGIKGYNIPKEKLPPANLVFLVDKSIGIAQILFEIANTAIDSKG